MNPFRLAWAAFAVVGIALPAYSQTLESALDNPLGLTFSTVTYDYNTQQPLPGIVWFPQTATTHDTVDAAEASGLPVGSWTRLDATIQGPATVSWWWKADTGNPLERVGFVSDDHYFFAPDNAGWQYREVKIGCGEQVISWFLDVPISSGADGSAAAWLDEIVVTPMPTNSDIQAGLDNYTTDFYSEDWVAAVHGGAPGAFNGTVAQSGPVEEGQSSSMQFDVEGPFEISFDWGIESDIAAIDTAFKFEVDGTVRDSISGTESLFSSQKFEYGPGHHCLGFTFFRDFAYVPDPSNPDPPYNGGAEGFIDKMVITPIPASAALANAVDVPPSVYGKAWNRQTHTTHDGSDAAWATGLGVGDSEILYVELPDDAGLLSMWVKVSTEANAGYLDLWVDGSYISSFTGEQDWVKVEANLGQGRDRVLYCTYVRESSGAGNLGSNAAYVDQIELKPGVTNHQPDLSIKAPRSSRWMGKDRYNTSGAGQMAKYRAKLRRPFGKFKMNCQNDCPTDEDSIKFFGTRGNRNYDVFYIVKFEGKLYNISAEFQTGQFSTETLEYLQSEPFEVWINRKEGARRRTQSVRVRGVSETDGKKKDTIIARMKVDKFRR